MPEPALGSEWVLAHGAPPPPPGFALLWNAWSFEPVTLTVVMLAAWVYLAGAGRVAGWPRRRTGFFLFGLAVLTVALVSPLATLAHAFFWAHMVQHLLLTMVGASLLVLGAPLALAMRAMPASGRRRAAAVVHSPAARVLTNPLVAWCSFALVMWLTHFSPLYDLALENATVHLAEHVLYLVAGLLFWWPLAGLDPGAAGRMSFPGRLLYLLVALPQQSFLGLAILSAGEVLYPHYATLARSWGPSALADQELAGAVMWVLGDLLFLVALVVVVLAWMRHDQRDAERIDRRLGLR